MGQCAGKGDKLLLYGGKGGAALVERLLKTAGQFADEISHVDLFGGLLHGFGFDPVAAQPDVLLNGPGKEKRVLQYNDKVAAHFIQMQLADVQAIYADRA